MSKSFNLFLILTFIQILPSISSGGASSSAGFMPDLNQLYDLIKKYSNVSLGEYIEHHHCLNILDQIQPEGHDRFIKEV